MNFPSTSGTKIQSATDNPGRKSSMNGSTLPFQISSTANEMTQALMSILNVQNKKAITPGKRSRVNRKYAETLTSAEVVERIHLDNAKNRLTKGRKLGKKREIRKEREIRKAQKKLLKSVQVPTV
ncbi:hypothetical protein JTB14_023406 [Gonioctena quinquepunctata]|nr:hypothetical protein JTB14_023406 [Gonioctena quinquepunctata]